MDQYQDKESIIISAFHLACLRACFSQWWHFVDINLDCTERLASTIWKLFIAWSWIIFRNMFSRHASVSTTYHGRQSVHNAFGFPLCQSHLTKRKDDRHDGRRKRKKGHAKKEGYPIWWEGHAKKKKKKGYLICGERVVHGPRDTGV